MRSRARVAEHEVLRQRGRAGVVLAACSSAAVGRPTPPTTATRRSRRSPRAARCRASAPTVTLLPNHWWASSCAIEPLAPPSRVEVVDAEHRQPLRLERDLQRVVGDHHRVAVERVRAERVGEHRDHLAAGRRRPPRTCRAAASAGDEPAWPPAAAMSLVAVPADLQGGQVRRHRLALLVDPRRRAPAAVLGHERAVARPRGSRVRGAPRCGSAALSAGRSLHGNQVGAPLGWRGDEHAVGELLPSDRAPGPGIGAGVARVAAPRPRTRSPAPSGAAGRDPELARPRCGPAARPRRPRAPCATREPDQVEASRSSGSTARARAARRTALEPVAWRPVVAVEVVVLDV